MSGLARLAYWFSAQALPCCQDNSTTTYWQGEGLPWCNVACTPIPSWLYPRVRPPLNALLPSSAAAAPHAHTHTHTRVLFLCCLHTALGHLDPCMLTHFAGTKV